KFQEYFQRPAARKAAAPLGAGAQVHFTVESETFYFEKESAEARVSPGAAPSPQVLMEMGTAGAEKILSYPSEDVGQIGVHIARLILSSQPEEKVRLKLNTGFIGLFQKGYLGLLKTGGLA